MKLYGVEGTIIDKIMTVRGYKTNERCMFLGFTDGETCFTKVVRKKVHKICKAYGAMSTTGYVTKAWEHGRFRDPYLREDLQDYGIMTDTLDCSVNWENMDYVHKGVRAYCKSRPNTICMIQKYGAAMSHHHGIGKMTAPWLEGQIGKNQMEVFKVLKNHFDPNNIMNPGGTLGLDLSDDKKRMVK